MTRINCGIKPIDLADWHLIAEINEIPRVFEMCQNRIDKSIGVSDVPKDFRLGGGHVIFFINKLMYVHLRFSSLVEEFVYRKLDGDYIEKRAFLTILNVIDSLTDEQQKIFYNNYAPKERDAAIVAYRIIDRITESENLPQYQKRKESKQNAIQRLQKYIRPIEETNYQLNLF